VYVKDEEAHLNSFTITFTFVVSCEPLQLLQPFFGFHFGHVISKACYCVMNEAKVGVDMKEVSFKYVQVVLQKPIT
jgi:hypothetical protein